MNGSPNDLMPLWRGSAPLFIAWWDRRAPQDQTDLTKGQDDSSEVVEEASRRWAETLRGGVGRCHGGLGRHHLAASAPDFFRYLPESSHVPFVILFMVDKFCGKYALESLFLAFLEKIDPRKYRICKTYGNC